jgi:hypothetical protein
MRLQTSPSTNVLASHDRVFFAKTKQGCDLPVIDLSNPRFAVSEDPAMAHDLYEAFIKAERNRRRVPKFLMRMMLRSAAKKSLLIKALFNAKSDFLDGLSTYVMKLGAGNLVPPYDSALDRKFAASPHVPLLRLRMQQTAHFLADGLRADLREDDARLVLINIAGGPALDSMNAIILLNRSHPELLRRSITIHVLDSDQDGPAFGANALLSLTAGGGPLHGLDIAMNHQNYDWDSPTILERLVCESRREGAVIAASSEGGLFEYGSDEAILANLKALRAGAAHVAGSVTRADETRRRMIAETGFKLFPRGIEGFAPLATRAGYAIVKSGTVFLSDQVLLQPV